jgi:hypothetical protein
MNANQTVDRIAYTTPFKQNVQGRLLARFCLDAEGEPQYETDDDDPRLRHYTIEVFLETPRAKEIKGVSYFLDDPSYIDPEGYSDDKDNEFREEITSYGDVEIEVTVEMPPQKLRQRAWLSNMLENGHATDMRRAVRAALERIKAN